MVIDYFYKKNFLQLKTLRNKLYWNYVYLRTQSLTLIRFQ